jgi:hypothetical protein
MTKIKMLAAAVAVASVSSLAVADVPPGPPSVYGPGPFSGTVSSTNLSPQERAAYALLEGMMQLAEAKIHAGGCTPVDLPLTVLSTSPAPVTGTATLGFGFNAVVLNAAATATPTFQGQNIGVSQTGAGYIGSTAVAAYTGNHIYNSANNLMVGAMHTGTAVSINGVANQFTGSIIKDFYLGTATADTNDNHIVYDWGLQSLSKGGFPVEKYWQRSKVRRSDGGNGFTAFVKDRLVGPSICRISIYMEGVNSPPQKSFSQSGYLQILNTEAPSVAPADINKVVDI